MRYTLFTNDAGGVLESVTGPNGGYRLARPAEEITLLGLMMSPWHSAAAIGVSLALMHAFVYAVEFSGQHAVPAGTPFHHDGSWYSATFTSVISSKPGL